MMVLGVGLMLSLFEGRPLTLEHQGWWCGFFRLKP
jgi:hypothetical protein